MCSGPDSLYNILLLVAQLSNILVSLSVLQVCILVTVKGHGVHWSAFFLESFDSHYRNVSEKERGVNWTRKTEKKEPSFFLRGHAYYLTITIFVPNINQSRLGCVAVTPVSISRLVEFKADIVNSFSSQNLHTFPAITHSTSFKSTTTLHVPF